MGDDRDGAVVEPEPEDTHVLKLGPSPHACGLKWSTNYDLFRLILDISAL
jgi:hypothetical protein